MLREFGLQIDQENYTMLEMIRSFSREKISDQVEHALKEWPRTRNSDNDLLLAVLFMNGVLLSPKDKEMFRRINFESVTRCRRKFQEDGQYEPTDPVVAQQRNFKALEIQQVAPSSTARQLQERIERN